MADVPIPGVLYQRHHPDPAWYAPGRPTLGAPVIEPPVDPPIDPPVDPPAGSNPLRAGVAYLKAGESLLDNKAAGLPVLLASSFSSTRDLTDLLHLIDDTAPTPCTVQLEAGVYDFTKMRSYSTTDKRGFTNAKRKVLGFVGRTGAFGELTTKIRVSPTMMSSTPGAVESSLNATKAAPAAPVVIYLSGSGAAYPLFISGIDFQGSLQTPYAQYPNATAQGISRNQTVPSPIVYQGLAIWAAPAGSRVQFCKFNGFSFSATTAPPFEAGAMSTNRSNGLTRYRCEVDGRIAAEIDPTRPRAGGGWMQNKESSQTAIDCWDHHTRNSGFATNTNTQDTSEVFTVSNYLVEEIANQLDGWVSDGTSTLPPGFAGSNVEGFLGTGTYTNFHANVARGSHINYAIPYSGSAGVYSLPNRVILRVTGFKTDDTEFGGLLRIATPKAPNSTGDSPMYTALVANFAAACAKYFDVRTAAGLPLTPVKYSVYVTNPAAYSPHTHYILRSL